jgi:hypothetical protein
MTFDWFSARHILIIEGKKGHNNSHYETKFQVKHFPRRRKRTRLSVTEKKSFRSSWADP